MGTKQHELEVEFDGLMPFMEIESFNGGTMNEDRNGEGNDIDDSDSENEEVVDDNTRSKVNPMKNNDIFGPSVDAFWGKKKLAKIVKRKTGKTAGCELPPEINDALNQACLHYANGDHTVAIELLSKVTRMAPLHPDPFHIMGLIYEESGNKFMTSFVCVLMYV